MPKQERLVTREPLTPAPPWLTELITVSSISASLIDQIYELDDSVKSQIDSSLLTDLLLILRRIFNIKLQNVFGGLYDFNTLAIESNANQSISLKTTAEYLQFVMGRIYDPLSQVIGNLQNGAHRSADSKYLSFFTQICGIKKQLEELLFE